MYTPDRGDIVKIDFDPSLGQEIMKTRPALVLSRKAFNEHTGLMLACPITSTIRGVGLDVVLPSTMETHGSVVVAQLRSMDFQSRNASYLETVDEERINKVTSIAKIIIS